MIDTQPTVCNLCGGEVIYCSNARIYGKEYGSGFCYLCQSCGAFVGTHKPRPREAMGLLADEPMRKGKKLCHQYFDHMWTKQKNLRRARGQAYRWLAGRMGVPIEDCHFGHFDIHQLRQAYRILRTNYNTLAYSEDIGFYETDDGQSA